jgi:hypothetical protein
MVKALSGLFSVCGHLVVSMTTQRGSGSVACAWCFCAGTGACQQAAIVLLRMYAAAMMT